MTDTGFLAKEAVRGETPSPRGHGRRDDEMGISDLAESVEQRRKLIERELAARLPVPEDEPRPVHEAMRYATLGAGKRLRPLLALSVCDLVDAPLHLVLDAACAIEFVHTASLILDDLPSMDDETLRRNKPCTHLEFGEATAILAAMGLIALGFELTAARAKGEDIQEEIRTLARAVGTRGIICGQHADLQLAGKDPSPEQFESVHHHKAGALFVAAVRIPAALLHLEAGEVDALKEYARHVGLAFQISDDLIDSGAGEKNLATRLGRHDAQERVDTLIDQAHEALAPLGPRTDSLRRLAEFVRTRVT